MNQSKLIYNALIERASDCIDIKDNLSVCQVLASVLIRLRSLDQLPIKLSTQYIVVNHFTRITELTAWLRQINDCIENGKNLIDSGILLESNGTKTSLDIFNTTPTSDVVPEKQCLNELHIRLTHLWLITRGQHSYYTRVLNPSLGHVYNYLMVYIRIIEDEQFQDESDT